MRKGQTLAEALHLLEKFHGYLGRATSAMGELGNAFSGKLGVEM